MDLFLRWTPTSFTYYSIDLDSRDLPIRQRWKLAKTRTTHEVIASLDEVPTRDDDGDIAINILGDTTASSFPSRSQNSKVISPSSQL